ncbi:sigma 54-interacting transcriptional regulator [Flavonifractor sp. DFI.6.63]|uniref:sigma-54 interaction domain-containing protein n=1 Tax=Flavonifractor sp. DFI.6.63 TaxID=2963704 RepID=UPI00210C9D26|nr:sigma 54-interacting transcriptional regulator [Flavonifractor sp. DFI.6.63]MCQ5030979.1 sigma 54-interacting transcriptional regulator [Flavonifractor sp. DFI.6.63]
MDNLLLERSKDNIYLDIVNSIYDGVCIYDGQGRPVYANDAHMKYLGFQEDEFWRIDLDTMIRLDPPLVSRAVTLEVLKTKQPRTRMVDYYRTGKSCLVSAMPFYLETGEVLVTSIIRDVTELLALQRRVEESEALQENYRSRVKELESNYVNPTIARTKSKAMSDIFEKASRIFNITAPVLLGGETGVGKDFFAKYLHENSTMEGPFIKVNCGAIPDNLLESELFGYEAGAFTGANKKGKAGLIELADNGTLYLDEIADLPLALQVKLLGVIQDRQVSRLGGTKSKPINFRIIAATNADLKARIAAGLFRADLYYRLNVISFNLPPLRQRREDIFPLADFFLRELNTEYHKHMFFEPRAIRLLNAYDWPGNIRELKNTLERIVVMINESCITRETLEQNLLSWETHSDLSDKPGATLLNTPGELKEKVARFEQAIIAEAIRDYGTLNKAAEALGIDVSTLVRKKKKFVSGTPVQHE